MSNSYTSLMSPQNPQVLARMNGGLQTRDLTPPRPGGTPAPGGSGQGKPGGPPQQGSGLFGNKPGGPPQMGPMQPNPYGGSGSRQGFGGQMGAMFGQPPQPGFPPPTGKPGLPPVNPSALNGQRPPIGGGIMPSNPSALAEVAQQSQVAIPPNVGGNNYTIGARSGGSNYHNPFVRPH